jgi:tRNA threonylcarbamoyladenosine biosynthesis protein TsaE
MCPAAQLQSQRVFVNVTVKPHALIVETRTLHWLDEHACEAFARALARLPLLRDATIELQGPLGAGKTTWVRHLLRALGVQGRIKSPTYALLEPYELPGGLTISHLDFYRLNAPQEWADAGLRDVLTAPGLKLLEWPERVAGLVPEPDLRLTIEPQADGSRQVLAQAFTARGAGLLS